MEPQTLALVGAAVAAAGAGLILWGVQALSTLRSGGTSRSLLAPTLAADTLDPDLRIAFMRTLVLDARGTARVGHPYEIGRRLRRAVVAAQAARFARDAPHPDEQALLELLNQICDQLEDEHPSHDTHHTWCADVVALRERLLVDDEDLNGAPNLADLNL